MGYKLEEERTGKITHTHTHTLFSLRIPYHPAPCTRLLGLTVNSLKNPPP
jgi:hypothetical protein